MTSILTNTGSMVALQTLRSINSNLAKTQSEISTGKSVASAKDDAAIWAISKTMQSDVSGFEKISSSLSLGESTVSVARKAAETITDLLTDMKEKVVAGQEDNVPSATIQKDVDAIRAQIKSVVAAAQYNGLNLIDGSVTTTNGVGNTGINVLSSLDRDSGGNVLASSIAVDAQNLSTTDGMVLAGAAASATSGGESNVLKGNIDGTADTLTIDTLKFLTSANADTGTTAISKITSGLNTSTDGGLIEGDELRLRIGGVEGRYVVQEGDSADEVLAGIAASLQQNGLDTSKVSVTAGSGKLDIQNLTNSDFSYEFSTTRGTGGMAALDDIDVTADPEAALATIETLLNVATEAAASLGSVESRISTQAEFISSLTDALTTGIGALVDADMEEVSARLQALQTQQQLGIQSLSIANQAPQNVLSLFK